MLVSVRGAGGLNLAMHSAEFDSRNPEEASFLASCRNVDLSLGRASMPRLGLAWPGLLYDEATGSLFTGITSLTGPITVLFPDPSLYAAKPGVGT
jgi:hypothetical protein